MSHWARKAFLGLVSGAAVFLAACGGGSGGNGGGGGGGLTTPKVSVMAKSSISTADPLQVTVTVSGGSVTPTGTVILTSASYSSKTTALVGGSATITIPAGSLAAGSNTLKASYAPDSSSSSTYNGASGTATVTVNSIVAPTVTVAPSTNSISTSQSLQVTITVAGTSGLATPTGTIVLSSGASYQSAATTLTGGSASLTIPGYSLAYGSATLSAAYTPDSQSTGTYNSAAGSATVSVARVTPAVTITPETTSIDTSQTLHVTVAVTGPGTGAPAATGTVKLTSGSYSSTTTLSSGSATITIAAGALPAGSNTLSAAYVVDSASSGLFNSAVGTSGAVTVFTATITVNQSIALAPVTDQLLGINLESWYDVVGNASSIDGAFEKAGIKTIRWPGGSWSDAYHWNSKPLPERCDTTTTGGLGWGGFSRFSDFMAAIPQAGPFDLAMTANYGSDATCTKGGDPTEAAAWAAEAVTLGYPPSHITVGNENYGSWEYDLHAKKNDPTTYANSVIGNNGFYKLITAASPTTKVGVVVDANCTSSSGCTNGWDTTVLSLAKGSYDFVEYHYYPQYQDVTSDTYLVHQAALDFTTNINTVKSELAAAGEPNTPIYVGEVGGNSANPGTQSWSITQGLYAGQLLGEAMNDGISRLTWWDGFGNCFGPGNNSPSLYGWQDWGAQSVFSDGPSATNCPNAGPIGTMSPTARAFQVFSNIAGTGESALSTAVTGDTTDIRAYSATHSGGTALFLFNLNQNQSQPVQIKLSKTPSGSSSDVTVITYDKSIYDQSNPANAGGVVWADPKTTDMGAQNLPLTLTLTPWSMNVVIIK